MWHVTQQLSFPTDEQMPEEPGPTLQPLPVEPKIMSQLVQVLSLKAKHWNPTRMNPVKDKKPSKWCHSLKKCPPNLRHVYWVDRNPFFRSKLCPFKWSDSVKKSPSHHFSAGLSKSQQVAKWQIQLCRSPCHQLASMWQLEPAPGRKTLFVEHVSVGIFHKQSDQFKIKNQQEPTRTNKNQNQQQPSAAGNSEIAISCQAIVAPLSTASALRRMRTGVPTLFGCYLFFPTKFMGFNHQTNTNNRNLVGLDGSISFADKIQTI